MVKKTYKYYEIFEPGENTVGVRFPDLPGAFSLGDSVDDVMKKAKECLAIYIDDALENGENLPSASTRKNICFDPSREYLCEIETSLAEVFPEKYGTAQKSKRGGARVGAGQSANAPQARSSRQLIVRITDDERDALERLAHKAGITKSALIKRWIRDAFARSSKSDTK